MPGSLATTETTPKASWLTWKIQTIRSSGRVTHGCPPTIALHCIAVGAGTLSLVGLGLYKAYFPKNICQELF